MSSEAQSRLSLALQPDGRRVPALRAVRGWTQRATATACGVSAPQLCRWETGRDRLPGEIWAMLREILSQTPPITDPIDPWVQRVTTFVRDNPGIARYELQHKVRSKYREAAIDRALRRGLIHEKKIIRTGRGRLNSHRYERHELYFGARADAHVMHTPVLDGATLRTLRQQRELSQYTLGVLIDLRDSTKRASIENTVAKWERTFVPDAYVDRVNKALTAQPVLSDRHLRALVKGIAKQVNAAPGFSRWDLARQLKVTRAPLRRRFGVALDKALSREEIHERINPATGRPGLYAGRSSRQWDPGPPMSGDELAMLRSRFELRQTEVGEILGVSGEMVSMWERDRQPIPNARRAQLRWEFAQPTIQPISGPNVRRARLEAGLSQSALAVRVGVLQTTVSRWEHGHRISLQNRLILRETLEGLGAAVTPG